MQNQEVYDELVAKFEKVYGEKPTIVSYAPGRIEVLGNHTDYNEGYVFSAAIDKGTFFAVAPTADDSCALTAGDFMETATFTTKTVAPAKEMTWQNYVTGTFNWLFEGKPETAPHGWKGMFLGNIPLGAGLSSSAALEMCTGLALAKLYGKDIDKTTMAKIGQKAEHTFAGCPCGLLDQASSMYGAEGSLVKSDFRTNSFETVSMGPTVAFMMVKSNEPPSGVRGCGEVLRECPAQAGDAPPRRDDGRVGSLSRWSFGDDGEARGASDRRRRARRSGRGAPREGRFEGVRRAHVRFARVEPQLVRELLRGARRDCRCREGAPRGLRRPSFRRRFRRQLLPSRRSDGGR